MTKFVVTCVNYGDSCGGKPHCLGIFPTEEAAKTYTRNDMEDVCDYLNGAAEEVDFENMTINCDNDLYCAWNIEEVKVEEEEETPVKEVIDKAKKYENMSAAEFYS